jgi:RNA polymerase sigma-70 factor, ECF subfamily
MCSGDNSSSLVFAEEHVLENSLMSCVASRNRLIENNVDHLRRFITRMRIPPSEVEDVLQQTLWRALNKFDQFRGDSRFFTWLCSIALNEARKVMRNKWHRLVILLDDELLDSAFSNGKSDTAFDLYRRLQEQTKIQAAVRCLKPELRTVIELHVFQGLTIEDTAKHLRLSVAATKSRFFRARRQLISKTAWIKAAAANKKTACCAPLM